MLETWWEESTAPGIAAYLCYKTALPIYRRIKQEDAKGVGQSPTEGSRAAPAHKRREMEVGRYPYVMRLPYTEVAYARRLLREGEG